MSDTVSQFFDALNVQEAAFIPEFASDSRGLILKAAINELDWYYYNLSQCKAATFDQTEQFYLLQLGVARLIKLSLEARPAFSVPSVMFQRDPGITLPVLQIVAGLGMIEHGRRVAQSALNGLCSIERTGANEFLIRLPSVVPDDEYYEREIAEHYKAQSRRRIELLFESDFGRQRGEEVGETLKKLVYPFQRHYIGYHAAPILDDYFFTVAFSEIQLTDGYDSFHGLVEFGGIPYQKYILALTFLVAISIRHERFAEALVEKEPGVKLDNVLTITSETEPFIESVRDAINQFGAVYDGFEDATLEDARRIFEVLSVSRRNTVLLNRPAAPLPMMVQSSDQSFIRSIAAARLSPMQFLLDSLRHHFPRDYDKHQQSRERTMQTAIKRVMDDAFDGLTYLENIKIRLGGREITDIDLVVTEESTGTVFLCQLKYQDMFGADLRSKHARTSRLREQTVRWLASLDEWVEAVGEAGVRASLRLPRRFPPLHIYRLVISRHYSYPLKDLAQNPETAHANWDQFFNSIELVKLEMRGGHTLGDLVVMLKKMEAPGGQQAHHDEPRSEWIIESLKFTVVQEEADRLPESSHAQRPQQADRG
ncbi:hypothetical protein ParKJ_21515 [Paraburkholderia fungorum]|uniref:Uncharacterized protein n=1 Tax=Paraburkholderia fungorum TaxID=134537 RepID=A0AAP5UVL9_9BURK|nr:hypothetical protein [Paraburkholderia fungorum]MDT8840011.1 hypothetical protein [Paraburkholderia fungorum]